MTAYEQGAKAARDGKPAVPPLEIESEHDAEAWAEGYWKVRQGIMVENVTQAMFGVPR